jgi:ACS family glucarate transporter-like MFS transporter
VGVIWWGVFTVATILVSPALGSVVLQLMVLRAVLGMGEAIVYPAGNQFLSRWIPVQERGKANGWIFAGVGAGAGLAPPLVTAIIAFGGWRLSFIVCAILGLVAGYFWHRMARDRPEGHPAVSEREIAHIKAGLPAHTKERPPTPWGAIFASKEVWGLFVSYSTFGYIVWLFFSWFFIYLAEARQIDLKSSAVYSMLPFIAMTVCCLAGGWLNDRIARKYGLFWGRSGLSIVAFVLTAGFLMFGSQAASVPLAVAALAGGGGSIYLAQSSFWSVTADISGPHTGVVSGFILPILRRDLGVSHALDRAELWLGRSVRNRCGACGHWRDRMDPCQSTGADRGRGQSRPARRQAGCCMMDRSRPEPSRTQVQALDQRRSPCCH